MKPKRSSGALVLAAKEVGAVLGAALDQIKELSKSACDGYFVDVTQQDGVQVYPMTDEEIDKMPMRRKARARKNPPNSLSKAV